MRHGRCDLKEIWCVFIYGKIETLFEFSGSALKLADAIVFGYLRIEIRQAPDNAI